MRRLGMTELLELSAEEYHLALAYLENKGYTMQRPLGVKGEQPCLFNTSGTCTANWTKDGGNKRYYLDECCLPDLQGSGLQLEE